jgi:hypothetical protein
MIMFENGDAQIMAEIFTPSWVSCLDEYEGVNVTHGTIIKCALDGCLFLGSHIHLAMSIILFVVHRL